MIVHASDLLVGDVDLISVYLQFQNPTRTSWKMGTKLSDADAFDGKDLMQQNSPVCGDPQAGLFFSLG